MSKAEAVAAGEELLGSQVTFKLPSGKRTVSDLLTRTQNSGLKVREAKNGPSARLTPGQKEMQQAAQQGQTVTPVGGNAANAGLAPGQPVKIDVFEEDRF